VWACQQCVNLQLSETWRVKIVIFIVLFFLVKILSFRASRKQIDKLPWKEIDRSMQDLTFYRQFVRLWFEMLITDTSKVQTIVSFLLKVVHPKLKSVSWFFHPHVFQTVWFTEHFQIQHSFLFHEESFFSQVEMIHLYNGVNC